MNTFLFFLKEKLLILYKAGINMRQPLVKFNICDARLPDLRSLLPLQYLEKQTKDDMPSAPWLTDDVGTFFEMLIKISMS